MNFPRFGNGPRSVVKMAAVVGALTLFSAAVGLDPSGGPTAQAATKKTATTTTKKKSSVTTTTKKSSSSSGSSTAKTTTTVASDASPTTVKGATTTTVKGSSSGSATTTTTAAPKPAGKATVFIPGAGRVIDLGAAEVAKLAAGGKVEADVRGAVGLAASGAGTVILDVTAANPAQSGTITVTPVAPEYARSTVGSTVGFVAGATTVSRVAVPIGANGLVRVNTTPGPSGLAISVVGWVITSAGAAAEPSAIVLEPCRVLDTVSGLGGLKDLVTPARPFDIPTTGIAKVPASVGGTQTPTGVILAVGASLASGPLDLSVVPTGSQSPSLAINLVPGQTSSALYVVPVGADARTAFYVSANGTQLTVDVVGWIDRDGVARSGGPC